MKYYPVAKPYITDKDIKSVLQVLRTDYLSLGPKYLQFEKKFAKKLGVKYACAVSSGTAGLHLSLIAGGVKEGDEVITTPFSFVASANVILYVRAKPVFVDIDPLTYNIAAPEIEKKITPKTKAILAVHIFGQPCDMGRIIKLAKKYRLMIIEDACESIGSTYRGKLAGTFGSSGVFAFYPNKQMTTGEGGVVATNDKKIYNLCSSLRNQGRDEDDRWLTHSRLGYNYRLDEMSAALGVSQLDKLDFMISERRKIAGWYNDFIKPYANLIQAPVVASGNTHTWFVYVVKLKNKKINRNLLISNLEKIGINTKPYLPSIHLFPFYKKNFGFKNGDFPISEQTSDYSLALPIYLGLRRRDCGYIIQRIIKEIEKIIN